MLHKKIEILQAFQTGLWSGELKFLVFGLTVITVINVVLSINLSRKLTKIKKETDKIEARNEALRATNGNLKDTIKRLNNAVRENEGRITFLGLQMEQVHGWLGRLTISDFISSDMTTTEVMDELTVRANYAKDEKENKD